MLLTARCCYRRAFHIAGVHRPFGPCRDQSDPLGWGSVLLVHLDCLPDLALCHDVHLSDGDQNYAYGAMYFGTIGNSPPPDQTKQGFVVKDHINHVLTFA